MHILFLASLLEKTAAKKTSGSPASLLFIVLIVVAVYFLVLRPRSRRARQQQQTRGNLEIGDEVISAGGILGRVTNVVGDEVEVEVAPGTTLTFWRRAVNLRSSVAGAPQSAPIDDAPPPGGHYGIEDRFDDEADGVGITDGGSAADHIGSEDGDGALYGTEPLDGADGTPPPPSPYLDPSGGVEPSAPGGAPETPPPAEER